MPGSTPLYCWDTSVFLVWLKKEQSNRKPGEWDAVLSCMERLKRREIRVFTSVLTVAEIMMSQLPAGAEALFELFLQRPNCTKIGIDMRVAKLASSLRDYYYRERDDKLTLSVPDSLQVATAILYKADEFHTFDEFDNRPYKWLALIPLSGNVAGHKLTICKPSEPQMGFNLRT
jgi:predicted nucleic acid-binding protein